MEISMIWAEDEAGWIGKAQAMPWHLSADLKHFKAVTSGHPIIMGATTFLSLGQRPLPNRTNVVVTHRTLTATGIEVVHSLTELRKWLAQTTAEEVFIIGGANLYAQMLPQVTRLYRTVITGDHQGDTKIPVIPYHEFTLVSKTAPAKEGDAEYSFELWQRRLDVQQDGKVDAS